MRPELQVGSVPEELEAFLAVHFHASLDRLFRTKKQEVDRVMKAASKEEWAKLMQETGLNKELSTILQETYRVAKTNFAADGLLYATVSVFYQAVFYRLPGLVDYRWCGAKPVAPYDLSFCAANGAGSREKVQLRQPTKPVVYELDD